MLKLRLSLKFLYERLAIGSRMMEGRHRSGSSVLLLLRDVIIRCQCYMRSQRSGISFLAKLHIFWKSFFYQFITIQFTILVYINLSTAVQFI